MKWGDVPASSDPTAIIQFTKQYVATSDASVSNTTTETSLLSGTFEGVGKTVAADKLKTGSVIRIRAGGMYSIPVTLGGNLLLRIKLGSLTLATITLTSGLLGLLLQTDQSFDLTASITVRQGGSSGSVAVTGSASFMTTASAAPQTIKFQSSNVITGINFSQANTIDVTAQWSVASANRVIKATVATINLED